MKKSLICAGILLLLCCAGLSMLHAQEQKIAIVDMEKLFQNYEKTKITEMQFNQQVEVVKEYARKLYSEVQTLKKEFEDLRNASQNMALSEAERENRKANAAEKYRVLMAKDRELNEFNLSREKQLREEYSAVCKKLVEEIRNAVKKYSILEGYHLVLDQSQVNSTIVYASPAIPDLTEKVLKNLNTVYRAGTSGDTTDKVSPAGKDETIHTEPQSSPSDTTSSDQTEGK